MVQTAGVGRLVVNCLGPLELSNNGHSLVLAGRSRVVLVALALSAGQVVPVERLVAAAWDDTDLPTNSRNGLQILISRLRTSLGSGLIETQDRGYRLRAEPDDVDALRFLGLLQGSQAADVRIVDEALSLWRGPPFADLKSSWLDRFERPHLVEQYLVAVELRADFALESGDAASQLPRLNQLAAEHPLRESLLARLLRSLEQTGRSAEALQRYDALRTELSDALGVDPGPELQDVHARLLNPTTAGPGTHRSSAAQSEPAPRQLPAAVSDFVGRADALAQLDDLLPADGIEAPGPAVISVIAGAAGVGKTTLALHWAHRVAHHFPDGQLYVNLRGFDPDSRVLDPGEAMRRFLEALGVAAERIPADPESRAGLYRSVLAGKRILVILDNARDVHQVRPLLPGSAGCQALVTSRNQLFPLVVSEAASLITVGLLTQAEARQLLLVRIGAERVSAEPDAAGEIIDSCARLPLALAIVAARAVMRRDLPLTALAAELREPGRRLDALTGDDSATDVRTVFSWSYRALGPQARRLFRLLSLHPGPSISTSAAASLVALSLPQAKAVLAELTRAHLIIEDSPGRFTFHDLLRAYASDLADRHDTEEERTAATYRILDWYLHNAGKAALLMSPHRELPECPPAHDGIILEPLADPGAALTWQRFERPAMLSVLERMSAADLHTHITAFAWAVSMFLTRQGHWADLVATSREELNSAIHLGDEKVQAHAHRQLATAFASLDRFDQADHHLLTALRLYTKLGDAVGTAFIHMRRSGRFAGNKKYEDALEQARLAHKFFLIAGDLAGQMMALNDIGWYQALQGQFREALTSIIKVRQHNVRRGDRTIQSATTMDSLGYVLHHLGHCQFAIACYRQALEIQAEFGARYHEAETLDHLGDAYRATGNHQAAITVWEKASTILDDLGHPNAALVHAKLPPQGLT